MVIWICILVSLAGFAYLGATDPKRRRVHKASKLTRRPFFWPARIAAFAPGIALIAMSHWSGLAIWAGALTVIVWGVAALPPQAYQVMGEKLAEQFAMIRALIAAAAGGLWIALAVGLRRIAALAPAAPALARSGGSSRIEELERRVEELEAKLAEMQEIGRAHV